MDFFTILTMLGGLALFLYGMNVMGQGLEKMAGGKLEYILEKMTSNTLKAVLLGTGVTAAIQSSSATTVMVIGFVNSGIMRLRQAIGVILGAKIGTTITAWILSLSGINGTSFWIKLFKPTSFSPVLAAIGIYFVMFVKNEKKKNIGIIFLGFAILMFGMDSMSGAMSPLADMPEFTQILTIFSNPFLGLLVGVALTAIIQSSSASVGILQALSLTGAIHIGTALPIVVGQNIGACVTPLLASIGTTKNAKRAAMSYLLATLIGAAVCMIGFYAINSFVHFEFLEGVANPVGVALIHTSFNVIIVAFLSPCIPLLEKLVRAIVKDGQHVAEEDKEFAILDEKFLNTPAFAIMKAKEATEKMAVICRDALSLSMELFEKYDENVANEVADMETRVDRYEDVLGSYLLQVSRKDITERDNMTVSMLLHCIGEFERISDHAVNISDAALEMKEKNVIFTDSGKAEINVYANAVTEIVSRAVDVFTNNDSDGAKLIEPLEDVIDDLNVRIKNRHIKRLTNGECTIENGFILADITTNFERISDHCSNIAVYVMQREDEEIEKHGYMDTLDKDADETFKMYFKDFKEKYNLPPRQ